jgi:hypothetical protein
MESQTKEMTFMDLKRIVDRENRNYSSELVELPREKWPKLSWIKEPVKVFRSRMLIVQVFEEAKGLIRISVNRTEIERHPDPPGWRFRDGLTWEMLQEIKNSIGYADSDALEIYPSNIDEVNVANMRHLWVTPAPIWFAWRNPNRPKISIARNMAEAGRIIQEGR